MLYKVTAPFSAFNKRLQTGDLVELTDDQAMAMYRCENIEPHEPGALSKPVKKVAKKRGKKVTKKR